MSGQVEKWAPRELRILNLVGQNFRTGGKWAPRELKRYNLVGQNFRTGRKWAPRELRIFNLVGQSFWPGLFSKVSADSHFGFKWNWPDALTPCLRVLTIFSLFLTISAGDDPFTGTSALEMP